MKLLAHALLTATALVGVSAFAEFQSPSGNITCKDFGTEVGCYISDSTAKKPAQPKPADCDLDWGNMFYVGKTGKASLECHGDMPVDTRNATTLTYGKTIKGNGWQCTSAKTGMTCKNSQGRGFTLSRAKQKLF